jgi:hypothetical protein
MVQSGTELFNLNILKVERSWTLSVCFVFIQLFSFNSVKNLLNSANPFGKVKGTAAESGIVGKSKNRRRTTDGF